MLTWPAFPPEMVMGQVSAGRLSVVSSNRSIVRHSLLSDKLRHRDALPGLLCLLTLQNHVSSTQDYAMENVYLSFVDVFLFSC